MPKFRSNKFAKIQWVGNNSIDKGGAQNEVIKNLKEGEFPFLSHTAVRGRWWGKGTFEQIKKLIMKDYGIYEIIMLGRKIKIFFDVDNTEKTLDEIKKHLAEHFPNCRMQISGYPGSYHIILSNYYANSITDMNRIRDFALCYKPDFGYDGAVYTVNRNMKCINQSKTKKLPEGYSKPPVQKYIEGSNEISKHLIMHDFDEDAIDVNTLKFILPIDQVLEKLEPAEREHTLDILSIPQHTLPVPANFDFYNSLPLEKLAMIPCPHRDSGRKLPHNIMWRIMLWSKSSGISWLDFYSWAKQKDRTVEFLQKYKDGWDYMVDNNYRCKMDVINLILERHYPDIKAPVAVLRMEKQFDINDIIVTDSYFLNANLISRDTKFVCLISQMFSNKTGTMVDYIKMLEDEKDVRILWMTPRITLSANTLMRLKKAGINIVNYREYSQKDKKLGKPEEESRNVIWSIQSLHYIKKSYDYIIIDESESVFNTFSKDCRTHGKLEDNWNIFKSLVDRAKQVFFLDALYSKLTDDVITGFQKNLHLKTELNGLVKILPGGTPKKPAEKMIITTKPRDDEQFKGKILEYEEFKTWFKDILERLKQGKKLYIFVPYKTGKKGVISLSESIRKYMGYADGTEIISYFAEKEKEKKDLYFIDKIWSNEKLRVVVTNSTISVGVNFDEPNVFDSVHVMYSPNLPLRDAFQSFRRVRRPISNVIHLFRTKQCFLGYDKRIKERTLPKCPIFENLRKNLDIEYLATKSIVTMNNWDAFNLFVQKTGYDMLPLNKEKVSKQVANEIKDLIESAECVFDWDKIKDVPDMYDNDKEMEKWMSKIYSSRATLDDKLQFLKYQFKKKIIPLEELCPNYTEFYNPELKDMLSNAHYQIFVRDIWKKFPNLPDKIRDLFYDNEHIIGRLFKENNISLDDIRVEYPGHIRDFYYEFPNNMKTNIPLKEIQDSFHFHNAPTNLQTSLVAGMINSFFGGIVYSLKKRKREDGTRFYQYETNANFGIAFRSACMITRKQWKKEEPEDMIIDDDIIILDDFEEDYDIYRLLDDDED